MRQIVRCFMLAILVIAYVGKPIYARLTEAHWRNFDIGGGVTPTLGTTDSRFTTGWNITGGGGVNFTNYFGVVAQVMYDGLG